MPPARTPDVCRTLGAGGLVRLAYRLGRELASGVLTLAVCPAPAGERPDVVVLRRGAAVCGDGELARRALIGRLARAAGAASVAATFDSGVAAWPPGALHQIPLADWARRHLEAQLDSALAERLARELGAARLSLRAELAPTAADEADRRILAALAVPRRLDQIWSLARTPRYRLLGTVHFLRSVGALIVEPVAATTARAAASPASASASATRPAPPRPIDPRLAAMRLLGVDDATDSDAVKRAYRRLARALHPDLQPGADPVQRRSLERRFAEVTAAYEALR